MLHYTTQPIKFPITSRAAISFRSDHILFVLIALASELVDFLIVDATFTASGLEVDHHGCIGWKLPVTAIAFEVSRGVGLTMLDIEV